LYFEYLERHQIINKNPYNLKLKHPKSNPRNILTQDQIKTLYKNCKTIVERTILNLCYGCGLRRSEAQHLEIKDINFDKKLLFVRSGKGKKRRVIPLTISLATDLKNFYNYSNTYRNPTQNTYLIHSQNRPISYTQLNRIFKKLLDNTNKNSQIENISLHSLRHSIATHLLENEMPIEMVRDFLGHSSLKTTQIYTRVTQIKIK
jgi:integrase/recombinase XerD